MNNELKILPLRKYEVTYYAADGFAANDVFTADYHNVVEGRTIFYRTGNVIREYHGIINRIVVTPVDAEEVPA